MSEISVTSYPYRVDPAGRFYPIIPLSLQHKRVKKEFYALIDSGATISVFREEVANSLGIAIESGKEIYLGGVGGRIKGYVHDLHVETANNKLLCPIVFSREYLVSFNLLGREAFFPKFQINFKEKMRIIELR